MDVACGTGVAARLAAEAVGAKGRVTGVDANPGMLAVARSMNTPGTPIEWYEARWKAFEEDGAMTISRISLW